MNSFFTAVDWEHYHHFCSSSVSILFSNHLSYYNPMFLESVVLVLVPSCSNVVFQEETFGTSRTSIVGSEKAISETRGKNQP